MPRGAGTGQGEGEGVVSMLVEGVGLREERRAAAAVEDEVVGEVGVR